jgi:glyoxylase-like metal-dependent hydrolase (beta-lactamase superfamily II)
MFKLLTTGFFYADGGAMFGAIPKISWSRSYPANERNLCILAMHAGVVKTASGRIIVIDPGVGQDQLNTSPAIYYRFHNMKNLCEELQQTGIRPEEVTDVIFTHLHFDHCGAAVRKNTANGRSEPTFPKAIHWVSRAQYENEQRPHPLEAKSFLPENTETLARAGLLRLVEATTEPFDGLRLQLYDGHTLGQIAVTIATTSLSRDAENTSPPAPSSPSVASDLTTIVFPGDILPLSSHTVPERISAYDLYPTLSYNGKTSLLQTASSGKQLLVFYHDALTPCATIAKVGSSFRINKYQIPHAP